MNVEEMLVSKLRENFDRSYFPDVLDDGEESKTSPSFGISNSKLKTMILNNHGSKFFIIAPKFNEEIYSLMILYTILEYYYKEEVVLYIPDKNFINFNTGFYIDENDVNIKRYINENDVIINIGANLNYDFNEKTYFEFNELMIDPAKESYISIIISTFFDELKDINMLDASMVLASIGLYDSQSDSFGYNRNILKYVASKISEPFKNSIRAIFTDISSLELGIEPFTIKNTVSFFVQLFAIHNLCSQIPIIIENIFKYSNNLSIMNTIARFLDEYEIPNIYNSINDYILQNSIIANNIYDEISFNIDKKELNNLLSIYNNYSMDEISFLLLHFSNIGYYNGELIPISSKNNILYAIGSYDSLSYKILAIIRKDNLEIGMKSKVFVAHNRIIVKMSNSKVFNDFLEIYNKFLKRVKLFNDANKNIINLKNEFNIIEMNDLSEKYRFIQYSPYKYNNKNIYFKYSDKIGIGAENFIKYNTNPLEYCKRYIIVGCTNFTHKHFQLKCLELQNKVKNHEDTYSVYFSLDDIRKFDIMVEFVK